MSITFPTFTGIRCLMLPFIQGRPKSVPEQYRKGYEEIIDSTFIEEGKIGFLTIDESETVPGKPHRASRAQFGRAIHTEAGRYCGVYCWGGGYNVELDRGTRILLANNVDDSCAVWDTEELLPSPDGDLGAEAWKYPYESAQMMKAGEVREIGILTPHESLPIKEKVKRQFLRIVGEGVRGREEHFTVNPLVSHA